MATFTPNYGLHQWEPEDSFLRTDFNEDHIKMDQALLALEELAEGRAQVIVGSYVGNGESQSVELGAAVRALVLANGTMTVLFTQGNSGSYGLSLTESGFDLWHQNSSSGSYSANVDNLTYRYLAVV